MDPEFKLISLGDEMDTLQRQINDYGERLQRAEGQVKQRERHGKETGPLQNQIEVYRYLKAEAEHLWDKKCAQAQRLRLEIKRAVQADRALAEGLSHD